MLTFSTMDRSWSRTTIVRLCAESSKEQVARTRGNHTHHKERLNGVGQRNSTIISNAVSEKMKLLNGAVGLVIVCSRARIAHSRHVNGTSPHYDLRVLQRSVADCDGTHIQPGDAVCKDVQERAVAQTEPSTMMVMLRR